MTSNNNPQRLGAAFLTYCRVENYTPKTISWHNASITKFARFCAANGIEDLCALKIADLREYVAFLQNSKGRGNRPMSDHSVATYVRSLRAWFGWLHTEGYLDSNPAERLKIPKAVEVDVTLFTPAEIKRVLAACGGPYALRDAALVWLLYDTGIRASEAVTARLKDFTDMPPSVRVLGKGRKYREVPIGRKAARAIRAYLRTRLDHSEYLFVGKNEEPLSPNGLLQMLERRGRIAGVHANPHKFRHTFAVEFLRNGGGELALQRILGHTTLEMVRHYARLANTDVAEFHRLASPGDRI